MLVCKEKKTDVENFVFQAQEVVWKLGVIFFFREDFGLSLWSGHRPLVNKWQSCQVDIFLPAKCSVLPSKGLVYPCVHHRDVRRSFCDRLCVKGDCQAPFCQVNAAKFIPCSLPSGFQ